MSVSRFAALAGIPERTYWRRLARHRIGDPSKGPWPSPKVDQVEATAAKYAADWPAWGHRKIAAMMRVDGHQVSTSTVERALRRRGIWRIADDFVIGEAPAPVAVVTDNGPCFRGTVFAEAFTGDDPLFRHVRTRVRSPQTNGVVEQFFGTLKYEHLYRAVIGDGNALAIEINCFRHTYNTLRPHQALDDRTPRQAYLTGRESQ